MTSTTLQKIYSLLDNFETGEKFLKSLEEIKQDIELDMDENELVTERIIELKLLNLLSTPVLEYFFQDKLSDDMITFFYTLYLDSFIRSIPDIFNFLINFLFFFLFFFSYTMSHYDLGPFTDLMAL